MTDGNENQNAAENEDLENKGNENSAENTNEGENSGNEDDDSSSSNTSGETDKDGDKDSEKQSKMEFAFKKKAFQLQQERNKREAAEEKARKAEEALQKATAPKRPEIPDFPDALDTDYDSKIALRDKAISDQAKYDQDILFAKRQQESVQQQVIEDRKTMLREKQQKYVERNDAIGIAPDEAKKYEDTVSKFITPSNAQTGEYLLSHKDGPLLVKYLAENPIELEAVAAMQPLDAAVYLATEVSKKAEGSRPKTPKTPAPVNTPERKGSPKGKHPALNGATFD